MNIIKKSWNKINLDELIEYEQPTKYIVKSTEYSNDYNIPVLTAGKSFLLGYTNEKESIFNHLPVIIFDDFTTATKFVNFPFKVKSSAMKILKPRNNSVNVKFVFYYMQTIQLKNDTHKRYWISEYSKLLIPNPSLEVQNLIVSKIEQLFSELENGKQQLETALQQLKIYRQSLLKWAFEGKLTNKNVKEGELQEGWKSMKLRDVCDKIQDGSHFSPKVQYFEPGENRFMYITAKNIRNNYMDLKKIIYTNKEFHDSIFERCNPEYGDVLLTKDGVNTGEVTINTLHEQFSLLSSVCLFKTNKTELEGKYLKYYIQSPLGSKLINNSMTGTAIKRIILRKIKEAEIILPTMDEQNLIVDELESKLTICDKMEETIVNSLQQAESLRQSILKKAFEGKLK